MIRLFVMLSCALLLLAACGGGGGGGGNAPVISNLTYSPQSFQATTNSVNISGKVNFTSDADIVSLRFTDSRGANATIPISGSAGLRTGYISIPSTPLTIASAEIYKFTVWLVDSAGRSSNTQNGSITITTPAPKAVAGSDFVTTTGLPTTLDGSSSVNYRGVTTSYLWSILKKPSNSNVTLAGSNTVTTSITPDIDGVYTLQLIINDGSVNSSPVTVNVTAIPAGFITIGSHKDSVLLVQGTPTVIPNMGIYDHYTWSYDKNAISVFNYFDFLKTTDKVFGWNNTDGSLKVIMVPGNNTSSATKISIGSHKDDVIKIQGTPTSIPDYRIYTYYRWSYNKNGLSSSTYFNFSTTDDTVIGWSNDDGSLKVQ